MTAVYESFADVVEEHDPELDGYDGDPPRARSTLRARVPAPPRTLMAATGRLEPAPAIVVPYAREAEGDASDYVFAIKRANARAKGARRLATLMRGRSAADDRRRRTWGPAFTRELGSAVYTRPLHERLAPHMDAYALELVRRALAGTKRDAIIARQVGWLNALYNRRYNVPYSQARPSQLVSADRVTRADCSGSIAGACAWAHILPAVDWRYTNTWSQIKLGRDVGSVLKAKVGDVFLYGSPSHEACYLGDGLVFSFGSYPAKVLRWNYRSDLTAIRRFVP